MPAARPRVRAVARLREAGRQPSPVTSAAPGATVPGRLDLHRWAVEHDRRVARRSPIAVVDIVHFRSGEFHEPGESSVAWSRRPGTVRHHRQRDLHRDEAVADAQATHQADMSRSGERSSDASGAPGCHVEDGGDAAVAHDGGAGNVVDAAVVGLEVLDHRPAAGRAARRPAGPRRGHSASTTTMIAATFSVEPRHARRPARVEHRHVFVATSPPGGRSRRWTDHPGCDLEGLDHRWTAAGCSTPRRRPRSCRP